MPRFEQTFCSQCGEEFGTGDSGFSHCDQHLPHESLAALRTRADGGDIRAVQELGRRANATHH